MCFRAAIFIALASAANAQAQTRDDTRQCARFSEPAAIAACTRVLEAMPIDHAERHATLERRGWAYFEQNQTEQARADFDAAQQLNPQSHGAAMGVAAVELSAQNYDAAISAYTHAIAIRPTAQAHNSRGVAYLDMRDYPLAIEDFTAAIQLDPRDAGTYNNRGWAYYLQGEFARAVADYNRALAIRPHHIDFHNRGLALFALGRDTEALDDFNESIRLNSGYAERYYDRGRLHRRQGDPELALADFSRAIELESVPINRIHKRRER